MKNKSNLRIIILAIGMVFVFLSINNYNIFNDQGYNGTIEIRDEANLKNLKRSGSYIESFIHIDGNWSATASTYAWCSGDGSRGNPYTIENVTIDASGSPTGSGIFINNSKNKYFILRNCNVINAPVGKYNAGIKLENTNNGTLTNNNCSNNGRFGILLLFFCNNNTISENFATNNGDKGITLLICYNTSLWGNTANDNGVDGIYLSGCDDNTISGNNASNIMTSNQDRGIYLASCDGNTISENTANDNHDYGISLNTCRDNTVSGNTANSNHDSGIDATTIPSREIQ